MKRREKFSDDSYLQLASNSKIKTKNKSNFLNQSQDSFNYSNEKEEENEQNKEVIIVRTNNDEVVDIEKEESILFDKLLVFTTSGCSYCKTTKKTLNDLKVNYEVINVDLFNETKELLLKYTNSFTFPQILFADKFIGGNQELQFIVRNNELQKYITQQTQTNITLNHPINKIYESYIQQKENINDENANHLMRNDYQKLIKILNCSPESFLQLLEEMTNKKTGIPIQNRTILFKQYRKCFVGTQAVDWISRKLNITRNEAIDIGNQMMKKHLIRNVSNDIQLFKDEFSFYRFIGDEDSLSIALNFCFVSMCEPKIASEISFTLRKLMLSIYDEYLSEDGKSLDYKGISASLEFQQYERAASELQRLDLSTMNRSETIAFFINIYNALIIHGFIKKGFPTSFFKRFGFFSNTSYVIGGNIYSLDDIEHGILRGNRRHPLSFSPPFSNSDPRRQFSITELDSRIHFALVCGAKGCPPIKVYSSENLSTELSSASQAFLESGCNLYPSSKEIHLSMILKWFKSDFVSHFTSNCKQNIQTENANHFYQSKVNKCFKSPHILTNLSSDRKLLFFIMQFLPENKAETLNQMLEGDFKIVYNPYDWSLNGMLPPR